MLQSLVQRTNYHLSLSIFYFLEMLRFHCHLLFTINISELISSQYLLLISHVSILTLQNQIFDPRVYTCLDIQKSFLLLLFSQIFKDPLFVFVLKITMKFLISSLLMLSLAPQSLKYFDHNKLYHNYIYYSSLVVLLHPVWELSIFFLFIYLGFPFPFPSFFSLFSLMVIDSVILLDAQYKINSGLFAVLSTTQSAPTSSCWFPHLYTPKRTTNSFLFSVVLFERSPLILGFSFLEPLICGSIHVPIVVRVFPVFKIKLWMKQNCWHNLPFFEKRVLMWTLFWAFLALLNHLSPHTHYFYLFLINIKTCLKMSWTQNYKTLEENTREKLHDTGLGNDFLDMSPKAQETKAKMNKWAYIKLKIWLYQRTQSK